MYTCPSLVNWKPFIQSLKKSRLHNYRPGSVVGVRDKVGNRMDGLHSKGEDR